MTAKSINRRYPLKQRPNVSIISINNTVSPRTGGEVVYKIIKQILLVQGYNVQDYSLPLIIKKLDK